MEKDERWREDGRKMKKKKLDVKRKRLIQKEKGGDME